MAYKYKSLRFKGMEITLEPMMFGKFRICFYEQFGRTFVPASEPVWFDEQERAERMFDMMVEALKKSNIQYELDVKEP